MRARRCPGAPHSAPPNPEHVCGRRADLAATLTGLRFARGARPVIIFKWLHDKFILRPRLERVRRQARS